MRDALSDLKATAVTNVAVVAGNAGQTVTVTITGTFSTTLLSATDVVKFNITTNSNPDTAVLDILNGTNTVPLTSVSTSAVQFEVVLDANALAYDEAASGSLDQNTSENMELVKRKCSTASCA